MPFGALLHRLPEKSTLCWNERKNASSFIGECARCIGCFHVATPIICKLVLNPNHYTFASMLLKKIVLRSKFHWTKSINHKYFHVSSAREPKSTARFGLEPKPSIGIRRLNLDLQIWWGRLSQPVIDTRMLISMTKVLKDPNGRYHHALLLRLRIRAEREITEGERDTDI